MKNYFTFGVIGLLLFFNCFQIVFLVFLFNQQKIVEERSKILSDGYDDVMAKYLSEIKESVDKNLREQGRLEGILSVIFNVKPTENEYSKIWHAGYNAGSEVSDFTEYSAYESGYMNACKDFELPIPLSPVPLKGNKN